MICRTDWVAHRDGSKLRIPWTLATRSARAATAGPRKRACHGWIPTSSVIEDARDWCAPPALPPPQLGDARRVRFACNAEEARVVVCFVAACACALCLHPPRGDARGADASCVVRCSPARTRRLLGRSCKAVETGITVPGVRAVVASCAGRCSGAARVLCPCLDREASTSAQRASSDRHWRRRRRPCRCAAHGSALPRAHWPRAWRARCGWHDRGLPGTDSDV